MKSLFFIKSAMIERYLTSQLRQDWGKRKILIVYGPRQVGKTTLVKQFITPDTVYYNCDQRLSVQKLETTNLSELEGLVARYSTVIIDEAQRVTNIGLTLKILIDHFPEKQFIVTGSSSLDLASRIHEPLTGRAFTYILFPVSLDELSFSRNPIELQAMLPERLIYGAYPEVVTTVDLPTKEKIIRNIAESYLFKDVLSLGVIKRPRLLQEILQAIALQLGNEVSLSELSRLISIDKETVRKYLDLCEQLFILFSLPAYTKNRRQAIAKKRKYYFYDLGIRNALINNFNPPALRADVGALWENFCLLERMKRNALLNRQPHYAFWRSYQKQEIDLIEDIGGAITGFEMKYSQTKVPQGTVRSFAELGGVSLWLVNKDNLFSTLLPPLPPNGLTK